MQLYLKSFTIVEIKPALTKSCICLSRRHCYRIESIYLRALFAAQCIDRYKADQGTDSAAAAAAISQNGLATEEDDPDFDDVTSATETNGKKYGNSHNKPSLDEEIKDTNHFFNVRNHIQKYFTGLKLI